MKLDLRKEISNNGTNYDYIYCLIRKKCGLTQVNRKTYGQCKNTCSPTKSFLDQFYLGYLSCFEGNYDEYLSIIKKQLQFTYQGISARNYIRDSKESPTWEQIKKKLKCYALCSDADFAQCLTVDTRNPSLPIWEAFLSNLVSLFKQDELWNRSSTDCRPAGRFGDSYSNKILRNLAAQDSDDVYMSESTDSEGLPGSGYDMTQSSSITKALSTASTPSQNCSNGSCLPLNGELTDSMMIIEFFWFLIALLVIIVEGYKFSNSRAVHPENNQVKIQVQPQVTSQVSIVPTDPQITKAIQQAPEKQKSTINVSKTSNNGPANQLKIINTPTPAPTLRSTQTVQSKSEKPMNQKESPETDRKKAFMKKLSSSVELMVNKHLVLFIIFIFLINNFKSHPYAAACIFLVLISLILFNYIKIFEIYGKQTLQIYSELVYQVWIFSLFFLYFLNETSAIGIQLMA